MAIGNFQNEAPGLTHGQTKVMSLAVMANSVSTWNKSAIALKVLDGFCSYFVSI